MITDTDKQEGHARANARGWLSSIHEMIAALPHGGTIEGEELDSDGVRERIEESPLSVEVRSDWHTPGDQDFSKPSEYNILLTTGGPALRILGDLDQYQQPETAKLQYQDWFTPWVNYTTTEEEDKALLAYAHEFFFGE